MPRLGGPGHSIIKESDLMERRREIADRAKQRIADLDEQIVSLKKRSKMVGELQAWMKPRKLTPKDVLWMYWRMQPQRAGAAVKSKKPLKPNGKLHPDVEAMRFAGNAKGGKKPKPNFGEGKHIPKGDPEFRKAIREKRLELGLSLKEAGEKVGVSQASVQNWECGRFIPANEGRLKMLKAYGLPLELGEAASTEMETKTGPKHLHAPSS